MTEKILPPEQRPPFEAAHNCICAYDDIPILDFYKGYYDTVYIMLHPFYRKNEQGNITQLISWQEFISLAGFKDIDQLDIALRNSIGGLKKKWENKADVEQLNRITEQYDLYMPSEGFFQEVLKSQMLTSLRELGHDYLYIADEWGFERKVDYIPAMIAGEQEVKLTYSGHDCWYTNHNEVLYTVHWDSHFTLLCSDRTTVEGILVKHPFEGFYCDDRTEIYWSLQDK